MNNGCAFLLAAQLSGGRVSSTRRLVVMAALVAAISRSAVAAPPPPAAPCMGLAENAAAKAQYPDLYTNLMSLMTCTDDPNDPVACNVFVSRAAEAYYNVSDFKKPDGTYAMANEIMDIVKANDAWSKLGDADDQATLDNAAAGAVNQMIIAIRSDDPHGHVMLILPGPQIASGQWTNEDGKSLKVPNSASFFLGHPEKAYVFCKASYGFKTNDGVEIWWRLKATQ